MDNPGFEIPAGLKCELKFMAPPLVTEPREPGQIHPAPQSRDSAEGSDLGADTRVAAVKPAEIRASQHGEARQSQDLPQSRFDAARVTTHSLGPFENRKSFEKVKTSLHGIPHTDRQERVIELVGFIVLTKAMSDKERARLRGQLAARRVKHFVYFKQPPYRGRYSLGVYDRKGRARDRVSALKKLGIEAEIKELTREKTQWWFDVEISTQSVQSTLELSKAAGD
jgi:hypothetical protein